MQDDKDLVHAFVQNDGLACLIKVGSENDQNYQNYILRGKSMETILSSVNWVTKVLTRVSTNCCILMVNQPREQ